jgi:hypothetical protein
MMHRWGYAPSLEMLASHLLGGGIPPEELARTLQAAPRITTIDGFACLSGQEDLVDPSRARVAMDRLFNGHAKALAREFARDLVRHCPFVECVALSGSAASGGYGPRDDVDFDLFVTPDTKYISYFLAQVIGLKYAWRYRHLPIDEAHALPFLSKVTCINVVWPTDQTQPFVRQDADLAFELLRCRPLYGVRRFQGALEDNPWLRRFFPQVYGRTWPEEHAETLSLVGRAFAAVARHPRLLWHLERLCRRASWIMYRSAQASRRANPKAVARMEFLRRVKYPYEVFQD